MKDRGTQDQRVIYLKLKRLEKTATYTMGALYVDGVFFCHTLELPVGTNTPRKEAILAGMYPVVLQAMSSRPDWGLLPLLLDVPDRSGIFAHIANKVEDILGCIGLGLERRPGGQLRRREPPGLPVPLRDAGGPEVQLFGPGGCGRRQAPARAFHVAQRCPGLPADRTDQSEPGACAQRGRVLHLRPVVRMEDPFRHRQRHYRFST